VGPRLVAIPRILPQHAQELPVTQHQHVIEALPAEAVYKPLTDGICPWYLIKCVDAIQAISLGRRMTSRSILGIVATDQVFGFLTERRGFAQRLRHPGVGRMGHGVDTDHPPRSLNWTMPKA
jgi:hypothetical protein